MTAPVTVPLSPLRPRTVLSLVVGRSAFRLASQATAVALLVVWGRTTFGSYANAVGVCTWLVLLVSGAEKAALKLCPRARLLGDDIARLVVLIALAPVGLLAVPLAVALVAGSGSTASLYLAAATVSATTGALLVVAGLHRLRGRSGCDAAAFAVGAAGTIGATALTAVFDLPPVGHLLVALGVLAAILTVLVVALPSRWRTTRGPRRRHLARFVVRNGVLLGAYDLLDSAGAAVVFTVLAASGRTGESGEVYLGLVVAAAVGATFVFLLRLAQPRTSVRLRGLGAADGTRRALANVRAAQWAGVAVAAGAAVALATGTDVGAAPSAASTAVLVALVGVEIAVFGAVTYAAFLLENSSGQALVITSAAAVAGFVATAALAVVLVPRLGGPGALAAVVLGLAVKAAAIRHRLRAAPQVRPAT